MILLIWFRLHILNMPQNRKCERDKFNEIFSMQQINLIYRVLQLSISVNVFQKDVKALGKKYFEIKQSVLY